MDINPREWIRRLELHRSAQLEISRLFGLEQMKSDRNIYSSMNITFCDIGLFSGNPENFGEGDKVGDL